MKAPLHVPQLKEQPICFDNPWHTSPECSSILWSCLDNHIQPGIMYSCYTFLYFGWQPAGPLLLAPSSKGLNSISKDLLQGKKTKQKKTLIYFKMHSCSWSKQIYLVWGGNAAHRTRSLHEQRGTSWMKKVTLRILKNCRMVWDIPEQLGSEELWIASICLCVSLSQVKASILHDAHTATSKTTRLRIVL